MDIQTRQAMQLINAGKIQEGLAELNRIVVENPSNISAWYALSRFTPDFFQKRQYLEVVLRLFPGHAKAKADLSELIEVYANENITTQSSLDASPYSSQVLGPSQSIGSINDKNYVFSEHTSQIDEIVSRFDEIDLVVDEIDSQIVNLKSTMGDLNDEIQDINSKIERIGEVINSHVEVIRELIDNVRRLSVYAHSHGPSDIALKEDITVIGDALARILSIRGVSFNWGNLQHSIPVRKTGRDFGVIAQDVADVFPELVATHAESGLLMVDYQGLVPVLIEAIRQQQAQLDELRSLLQVSSYTDPSAD
jgi:hypothetical protein